MEQKKLKVGLFTDAFFPYIDGVVMVVDNYAKNLNNICEVHVIAPKASNKKYKREKPYNIIECKSMRIPILKIDYPRPNRDKKFLKQLDELDLDIVHIHSPFAMGKLGIKYARKKGIPAIGTFHSQFKKDFKRFAKMNWLTNILLKKIMKNFNACNEVWTFNTGCRNTLMEYGFTGHCHLVSNGTDMTPVLDIKEQITKVNEEYNLTNVENVFIFVGRLYKAKNNSFNLNALAEIKKKGITNFKFVIVGTGEDEKALKSQTKKLGLEDNVIFTGLVKDRAKLGGLLARSDLFLFPSLYDMSSLVQIEAACYKTPVLFMEGANTASSVLDDINGFIGKNDLTLYANKIAELIDDKPKLKKVGEQANKDLYITWTQLMQKVHSRYMEVIENAKKA